MQNAGPSTSLRFAQDDTIVATISETGHQLCCKRTLAAFGVEDGAPANFLGHMASL
jgi:hypothetical protein